MTDKGDWLTFKTSPEMLRTGIFTERLVSDTHAFADYMAQKDRLPKIVKIKIAADPACFVPDMQLTFFSLH
jgi:hypothetical protein